MAGKAIRDIKLKGFSAIAAIVFGSVILIGVWSVVGQILPSKPRLTSENSVGTSPKTVNLAQPSPPATASKNSVVAQLPSDRSSASAPSVGKQGLLRVSNFSEHPVRVAVLLKKVGKSKTVSDADSIYEPPAHWDFSPGEGQTKGLVLSLPNRTLKLKRGDVLVAFAQDGSRRYWGPYVLGETIGPSWSADSAEWQLSLDP